MMAVQRNPGVGLLAKAMGAAEAAGPHPVMAAAQFNALHRAHGGATMNVHTGTPKIAGKSEGYAVGGATDNSGQRIPTHTTSRNQELHKKEGGQRLSEPSLDTTIHHAIKLRRSMSANPDAHMGSWQNDSGRIDIDASEVHQDHTHAVGLGQARGEAGIFDLKRAQTIRTDTGHLGHTH